MKYQRNPQTNLQIRIIKKKSLRGRKDFQCRYVYQYQNLWLNPTSKFFNLRNAPLRCQYVDAFVLFSLSRLLRRGYSA